VSVEQTLRERLARAICHADLECAERGCSCDKGTFYTGQSEWECRLSLADAVLAVMRSPEVVNALCFSITGKGYFKTHEQAHALVEEMVHDVFNPPIEVNLPFERVPQHATDPGVGPVPPRRGPEESGSDD
jgi:hypothetical protein